MYNDRNDLVCCDTLIHTLLPSQAQGGASWKSPYFFIRSYPFLLLCAVHLAP